MSRRHFRALAEVVAGFADRISDGLRWELCNAIADVCAGENRHFDRQRFREACGLDAWNRPA